MPNLNIAKIIKRKIGHNNNKKKVMKEGCNDLMTHISLTTTLNKTERDELYKIFLRSRVRFYRKCIETGLSAQFIDKLYVRFLYNSLDSKGKENKKLIIWNLYQKIKSEWN